MWEFIGFCSPKSVYYCIIIHCHAFNHIVEYVIDTLWRNATQKRGKWLTSEPVDTGRGICHEFSISKWRNHIKEGNSDGMNILQFYISLTSVTSNHTGIVNLTSGFSWL